MGVLRSLNIGEAINGQMKEEKEEEGRENMTTSQENRFLKRGNAW